MWYIKWRHIRGHNSGLTLVQGARGQEWVRCLLTTSKSPLQTNYRRGCHTHQVSYPGCPEGSPPWAHRSYATGTHSGFLKIFSLCSWSSPYSAPRDVVESSAIGIWSASSCKVLPITMNGYSFGPEIFTIFMWLDTGTVFSGNFLGLMWHKVTGIFCQDRGCLVRNIAGYVPAIHQYTKQYCWYGLLSVHWFQVAATSP